MKRRTFLKAAVGISLIPIAANAKLKPEIYSAKDVKLFIGGEEIKGFTEESVKVQSNWVEGTPEEIIADIKDAFSAATNIPKNRLFPEEPPQHINCRCEAIEISHDHSLDAWAKLTGVCRIPYETDSELRFRVFAKRRIIK